MVGICDDGISQFLVGFLHFFRRFISIGKYGVTVQIGLVKAAGFGQEIFSHGITFLMCTSFIIPRAPKRCNVLPDGKPYNYPTNTYTFLQPEILHFQTISPPADGNNKTSIDSLQRPFGWLFVMLRIDICFRFFRNAPHIKKYPWGKYCCGKKERSP